MVTFREALESGVRSATCTWVNSGDRARNWFADTTSTIPGVGGAIELFDNAADGFSALVCPEGGGSGVVRPPGGGRLTGNCDAVPYLFRWSYNNSSGGRTDQTIDSLFGPIGDFVITELSNGNSSVGIECRGVFGLGLEPAGFVRTLISNQPQDDIDPQILSLTRRDGEPDNCPPPGGGDDGPPTVDDDIIYDPPEGGPPITVPVTFVFGGPLLQVNNNFNVPITITGPSFSFDANFNFSTGDINFNFGNSNDDQSCCCLPEEEGEEDEPPDGERRILGATVSLSIIDTSPGITQVFNTTGPDLLLKDAGVIMFKVKVGESEAWLKPIQLQVSPQFIPVPEGEYAVDYSVLARPGVTAATTVLYATILPEVRLM